MSEDNSIQKGCVEYVVSEEDFEPKDPSSLNQIQIFSEKLCKFIIIKQEKTVMKL